MTDDMPTGYPETAVPAHGHPMYALFAHLGNAITALPGESWISLDQREVVARRTLTVAVFHLKQALHQASSAVVDLEVPDGYHSVREDAAFAAGFEAAQNAALKAIDALEERLVGGVVPAVDMLVPEIPDPTS